MRTYSTLDTEHIAPIERSMEPKISTLVMPTASVSSTALSRSMLTMFIRPRKLGWICSNTNASTTMQATDM